MYGGHNESDEWYTPRYVFDALGVEFDLDPAAPASGPRYVPALNFFHENALAKEWFGFVWLNPPFGHQSQKMQWASKFFGHGNGIMLLPDRTSAPWWQHIAPRSSAVLFMAGKVKFERPDGSIGEQPGNGTCLFAAGDRAAAILIQSGLGVVAQCG